jgi:hypothetical protein
MMKRLNLILCGVCVAFTAHSFAGNEALHIRGEVTSVSADEITITARNGTRTVVKLPEQAKVLDVSKANISAIQDNSYIGIAAAPAAQGKLKALGVMVFPEGARGLNEGQFPWDKGSRSTMTNATVAGVAHKTSATEIEVRFGDKIRTVVIDQGTVIGQFVPGPRDLINPKSKVMIIAEPGDTGTPVADMVMVGRDGFMPPI